MGLLQLRTDVCAKSRRFKRPNPQALEDRIRLGMISELQRDLLAGYQAPP